MQQLWLVSSKKIKNDDATKYTTFHSNSKAEMMKDIWMRKTLMMNLNESILQLYQTYKNISEKLQAGLLIQ